MFIKHLSLASFRNYQTAEIALQPGVNLLVGPNGQGKTNVVEAIEYVSTLSSHRVAGYQALIHKDAAQAIVRLKVSHQDRDVLVDIELSRENSNQLRINQSPVNRMRDVLGTVQSVVFAPEDIDIVKRGQGVDHREIGITAIVWRGTGHGAVPDRFPIDHVHDVEPRSDDRIIGAKAKLPGGREARLVQRVLDLVFAVNRMGAGQQRTERLAAQHVIAARRLDLVGRV